MAPFLVRIIYLIITLDIVSQCTLGMYVVRLIAILWSLPVATAAFRPGGTAPYVNTTSATQQLPYRVYNSSSLIKETGYANSTEQGSVEPSASIIQANNTPNSTSTTANSSCTVNVRNAQLEWWYPATYEQVVGTLTTSASNFTNAGGYLTLVPATTTFDVSYTISNELALTETSYYDTEFDVYWTLYDDYTVIPTASATSIVTRNAALPLPSGNIIPVNDYSRYVVDLAPATASVALVANSTSITSATPFVYITAYEVESAVNGSIATETITLDQPSGFEYSITNIESSASATGTVPGNLLQNLPQTSCTPGIIYATVTVLVVLDLSYLHRARAIPLLVHFESTALDFGSDPPVNVQATSQGTPFVVSWDFPNSGLAQTTIADAASRPSAVPQKPEATAGPDGINVGENFPNVLQPTSQTVGTIGTNPVVVAPSSVMVVGSQTLKPGGPAITVDGSLVSLVPSGTAVVVGGTTSPIPINISPPSGPAPPILKIGSLTFTANAATQFFISAGQTLTPGGTAMVDDTVVSLGPSASFVVVGRLTQSLPAASPVLPTARPEIVVGSSTVTANAGGPNNMNGEFPTDGIGNLGPTFVVSGQTLPPGSAITVGGTTLSLAGSGSSIVINGVTSIFSARITSQVTPPLLTIGPDVFFPLGGTGTSYHIGTTVLTPGGKIVVSGSTISLALEATAIIVNNVTSTLSPQLKSLPHLTIGEQVYTAISRSRADTSYVIGSQTLTPGGQITVSSTTISLTPDATAIIINGVTSTLSPQLPTTTTTTTTTSPPILTIDGQTYTPLLSVETSYIIASQSLTLGAQISFLDTTISLARSATTLSSQPIITNPPLLTIGSHTYTAVSGTCTIFVIGGQTLTPGGTIVVDGMTIVLAPGATQVVYGSGGERTTEVLFPAAMTSGGSLATSASAGVGATGQGGDLVATGIKRGAGNRVNVCGMVKWMVVFWIGLGWLD
ncbi:hypothetical protein P280DRAFT_463497 [Massarina eburnea CBS 473.64]|uniref:Uncharacterized protein n=1 Tax=Massarina eburnea CBS 473.64 TaxID=1395130 RepID=A0A6A6RH81_9PLEO|nr:hypothetical protein P280DRAFT_463497 [Massarina eburnea CBS 473.64]